MKTHFHMGLDNHSLITFVWQLSDKTYHRCFCDLIQSQVHNSICTKSNITINTVVMNVLGIVNNIREWAMMAFLVVVIAFACFRICLPRAWKPACHCKSSQCKLKKHDMVGEWWFLYVVSHTASTCVTLALCLVREHPLVEKSWLVPLLFPRCPSFSILGVLPTIQPMGLRQGTNTLSIFIRQVQVYFVLL